MKKIFQEEIEDILKKKDNIYKKKVSKSLNVKDFSNKTLKIKEKIINLYYNLINKLKK
jgi:hypothetical protein